MTEMLNAVDFLASARRKMRFGQYSREPLNLLRLQWSETRVECDWLMRPPDAWDRFLTMELAEKHQTHQALRDALGLRDILFECFPGVSYADLKMFRSDGANLELMLTGSVARTNEILHRVPSVAMRAKLCGFRFILTEGVLESLHAMSVGCM